MVMVIGMGIITPMTTTKTMTTMANTSQTMAYLDSLRVSRQLQAEKTVAHFQDSFSQSVSQSVCFSVSE